MKSKDQKEQGAQPEGVPEKKKKRDDKRDGHAPPKVAQQRSVLA